jgi:fatty-acyl-CoA synthase
MVVDFLAQKNLGGYDLRSLALVGGGGAPLPQAVGEKLRETTGLSYVEGYGLSETMSQTHFNPPDRPKLQCLGLPTFDTDARVVDPDTLEELPPGEQGEIIVAGPQVMREYWNKPGKTREALLERDGKTFLRTGDIGRMDEEGYFFMVDRAKRMINAAGFKVWPAEVESSLYQHPAIREVCVIGVPDERRGETVEAVVVPDDPQRADADEIIAWAKEHMAGYKVPRLIKFVDSLPRSGTGKIQWRELQEREAEAIRQKSG